MIISNEKKMNLPADCFPENSLNKTDRIDFALQTAIAVAKQKLPVAIFSPDIPAELMTEKIISLQAGFTTDNIKDKNITVDEWDMVTKAINATAEYPIFFDDTAEITAEDIKEKVNLINGTHETDSIALVILLLSDKHHENCPQISELKVMSEELDISVIALSQHPCPAE